MTFEFVSAFDIGPAGPLEAWLALYVTGSTDTGSRV
jgi:hypothetical protein